jgi:hypothetical protein
MPAGAEIVVNVGGGIGLGLAIADITGGIEAIGVAGLYTALTVRPQFKYAGGKYTISGIAELAGVAQVKFGINAFAKIDVGVWLFKGTVWRKDWTLAEWIWNTGLNIALRANISYTLGDDFAPDISFETGQVDPEKFIKDVMPESGSPVPAPPKPAVPEKGAFTAEGATGGQTGGASGETPTATAGTPSATTSPGTVPVTGPGGAPAGPEGASGPSQGPKTPEQHKLKVDAGLAAIDQEEQAFMVEGKITHGQAAKVAELVKTKHPVFKSITVSDGGTSWDYDYVASPGLKKKGPGKSLLPNEGQVGTYGELIPGGGSGTGYVGDNVTPHHIPQNSFMLQKAKAYGYSTNDGICINMEGQPGGRHRRTRTCSAGTFLSSTPQQELDADIADVRAIYQADNLYPLIASALQRVRSLNYSTFPTLFP